MTQTRLITTRGAADFVGATLPTFLRLWVRSGRVQPVVCRVTDRANMYSLAAVMRAERDMRVEELQRLQESLTLSA